MTTEPTIENGLSGEALREERECTCGAGHGSLEGHTGWCAYQPKKESPIMLTDAQIKIMAERFLMWKLPADSWRRSANWPRPAWTSRAPMSAKRRCRSPSWR